MPRPRFSLLLSALVALAALAIVLAGTGGHGRGQTRRPRGPSVAGQRVRACITTSALARMGLRRQILDPAPGTCPARGLAPGSCLARGLAAE